MTVMTREQQLLLEQLRTIGGSSDIVVEALKSFEPARGLPTFEDIVKRILEIRYARQHEAAQDTATAR